MNLVHWSDIVRWIRDLPDSRAEVVLRPAGPDGPLIRLECFVTLLDQGPFNPEPTAITINTHHAAQIEVAREAIEIATVVDSPPGLLLTFDGGHSLELTRPRWQMFARVGSAC